MLVVQACLEDKSTYIAAVGQVNPFVVSRVLFDHVCKCQPCGKRGKGCAVHADLAENKRVEVLYTGIACLGTEQCLAEARLRECLAACMADLMNDMIAQLLTIESYSRRLHNLAVGGLQRCYRSAFARKCPANAFSRSQKLGLNGLGPIAPLKLPQLSMISCCGLLAGANRCRRLVRRQE